MMEENRIKESEGEYSQKVPKNTINTEGKYSHGMLKIKTINLSTVAYTLLFKRCEHGELYRPKTLIYASQIATNMTVAEKFWDRSEQGLLHFFYV